MNVSFDILDDAALSSRIVLSQGSGSVSIFFADQGTAVLRAQVDSASSTAGYSFVWSQTDVDLEPSEGLNSETFSFDPQGHVGSHELSVVVTDPVGTTVTISREISIRSTLPEMVFPITLTLSQAHHKFIQILSTIWLTPRLACCLFWAMFLT
ncbi:hypothetical protein VIC_002335 [Vibrio coralliilyticus ATCC BAA-450]|nr:hypothetical protein VIC_002335 [Vibrio coralliilyticus ATCC BAA-450]